ncbi:MAG: M48 family metallopeptidase [Armatimonadota bacterium]|nr:M48 family metallopeptidase [Armatimonadota bacterium]
MRPTFWNEIAANKRWSAFYCVLMALLLTGMGAAGGYIWNPEMWPFTAGIAALIGIGLAIYANTAGGNAILSISGAREATHEEYQVYVNVAHEMSIAAGLPLPKLYVVDEASPNAFATGTKPENSVICVTSGLLDQLDRNELQGVVAHEMSHIRNYDVRLLTTLALTVGVIVLMRDLFIRGRFHSGSRKEGNGIVMIVAIVFIILAPIFAMLLRMAMSRNREYLADATAVQLTRYPEGLANALEKIALAEDTQVDTANAGTAPMFIVDPLRAHALEHERVGLFSTHPPTSDRIRRLRAMGLQGSGTAAFDIPPQA